MRRAAQHQQRGAEPKQAKSCRQQHSHEQIEQDGHCFPFDLGEGQGTSRLGPPNNIRPMMAGAMLMTNMLIWNKRMKAAARAASRFQPGLLAFTWSARACQRNPWASSGTSSAPHPPMRRGAWGDSGGEEG